MKNLVFFLIFFSIIWNGFAENYIISSPNIVIELNKAGNIISVKKTGTNRKLKINGLFEIEGLFVNKTAVKERQDGSIEVNYLMADKNGDRTCMVSQIYIPTAHSVKVDVKITGENYDWSSPVLSTFNFPAKEARFWTSWGLGDDADMAFSLDGEKVEPKGKLHQSVWHDPLVQQDFRDMKLAYGGRRHISHYKKGFSLPLAVVLFPEENQSVNIVLNPNDTIINLNLNTTKEGKLSFSYENYRIGPGQTVSFSYDIFIEQADWRPALGWMCKKYPDFFEPALEYVHDLAGCSSYSGYNGDLDIEKMKHIAYGFNWYASRSWPYLGQFLPPVKDDESWISWSGFGSGTATSGKVTSYESINNDYKQMHERGFHQLAYFNLNEFGYQIKFPFEPICEEISEQDWWKESNVLLQKKLRSAMLFTEDNHARFSWNKSVVMDPGHPVYHQYLMEHVQRHIDKVPEFDGIGIDRLDWFEWFNYRRDDGISMVNGKKVWAMSLSLHKIMEPLSSLLHENGKALFYNPHLTRLDFAKYFDGIFDEFADNGDKINMTSLLALKKPIVGWIHSEDILRENPDYLIQKFLYLGVYPMAPYTEANHSLVATEYADSVFADYGLMFQQLKGKEWIFDANPVQVKNKEAKANIFKTNNGLIVALMLGNPNKYSLAIRLNDIKRYFQEDKCRAFIIHPGSLKMKSMKINSFSDQDIEVPLVRGCAMLVLQ